MKKWIVLTVGWLFVVVGILGIILPVLPGVFPLIVGLLLLATEYVWAKRLVEKTSRKYPRVGSVLDRATGYVERIVARIHGMFGGKPGDESNTGFNNDPK